MKDFNPILRRCPLFDGVADADLPAILTCLGAVQKSYGRGELIFQEGEPAVYVGIVLSGSVRLIREDYYGNRSILAHISPAGLFGESYACAGIPTLPISAAADEDSCCLLIDCRRITQSCTNACSFHTQTVFNLLRIVAKNNLLFDQKIQITSKRSTREKLMTYLLMEAKKNASGSFFIPYDRQELADYLEVDRSGLSVEISKLRKEKILSCEKNHFTLL